MAMKLEMNFQARQEVEAARISENEQQLALEEEALTILETRIRSQDEKLRAKIEQIAEEARTQVEEVEAEAKLLGVPAVNEMSSESVNKPGASEPASPGSPAESSTKPPEAVTPDEGGNVSAESAVVPGDGSMVSQEKTSSMEKAFADKDKLTMPMLQEKAPTAEKDVPNTANEPTLSKSTKTKLPRFLDTKVYSEDNDSVVVEVPSERMRIRMNVLDK